jgi:hypothetical protein
LFLGEEVPLVIQVGREARFVSLGKKNQKTFSSHLTRNRHAKYVGRLPLKAVS